MPIIPILSRRPTSNRRVSGAGSGKAVTNASQSDGLSRPFNGLLSLHAIPGMTGHRPVRDGGVFRYSSNSSSERRFGHRRMDRSNWARSRMSSICWRRSPGKGPKRSSSKRQSSWCGSLKRPVRFLVRFLVAPPTPPKSVPTSCSCSVPPPDWSGQVDRNLQLATEQAIGKLVQFFGIEIERHGANLNAECGVLSLRSASQFGLLAIEPPSAFPIVPKTTGAGN